ncbi:noggin 5 [Denticeps clupeoides]|uniref:noggin 5 n=1 Tax=Denticeps clupeoides TaxID=299321 RepID=UPI0010A3D5AF|nr:noggin-2-like [Denticeps clupeoides]
MKFPVALLLIAFVQQVRGTQPFLRVRPSPSDHLPVLDLKEDLDTLQGPNEDALSTPVLQGKLGKQFDPVHMSITPPSEQGNASRSDSRAGSTLRAMEELGLSRSLHGAGLRVGKRARDRFRRWLVTYTRCPVLHAWKDLGTRFWPRYLNQGRCSRDRSCSVPGGMFCKPSGSATVTLLRWRCQGVARRQHCSWIRVKYPIISQCQCSC